MTGVEGKVETSTEFKWKIHYKLLQGSFSFCISLKAIKRTLCVPQTALFLCGPGKERTWVRISR